ncbi:MAG: chloride channel protein, partial [Gammaproteobacteria bacterium]
IGPMVVMGATAGGALGMVGHSLVPASSSDPGFYAALGMVAMMGASLQAPLAALMAILELTANPNTILPGMVTVVTAFLVARVTFRQDPIFVSILRGRGIDYRFDPVALSLERMGVGAAMSRRFAFLEVGADRQALAAALSGSPEWLLVVDGDSVRGVVRAHALSAARAAAAAAGKPEQGGLDDAAQAIPLSPDSLNFTLVARHATLREALARLDEQAVDLVLVSRDGTARCNQVRGVLSRQQIESSVRYRF